MSIESIVGLIDMLMVGRLGADAVAGVGVATQILFGISTVIFAVGTGAVAIVARHIGAKEKLQADLAVAQSLLTVLVLALIVIVPGIFFALDIVRVFGVADPVVREASSYLRIVLCGFPFEAIFMVLSFGLRGAGDTRTPLFVSCIVAIVNIVGNYIFIFGHFGAPVMGASGAACGTLIAFAVAGVLLTTLFVRGKLILGWAPGAWRPDVEMIKRILKVGYPAALEHVLMQFGFLVYFAFVAHYGTHAVAAYVIGVRVLALSFLPGFGFSAAASTLVGQNLGARKAEEAERNGWECIRLAVYLMSFAGCLIFIFSSQIAGLFIDDPRVIADAVPFICVLAIAQPLMAIDFTLSGALRGAGDTRFPVIALFVGFYICRLTFAYTVTTVLSLGIIWLWSALLGDYLARSIMKTLRFRAGAWKSIRV